MSRGPEASPKENKMSALIVAAAFVLMVLSPCIVAFSNTPTEE